MADAKEIQSTVQETMDRATEAAWNGQFGTEHRAKLVCTIDEWEAAMQPMVDAGGEWVDEGKWAIKTGQWQMPNPNWQGQIVACGAVGVIEISATVKKK